MVGLPQHRVHPVYLFSYTETMLPRIPFPAQVQVDIGCKRNLAWIREGKNGTAAIFLLQRPVRGMEHGALSQLMPPLPLWFTLLVCAVPALTAPTGGSFSF